MPTLDCQHCCCSADYTATQQVPLTVTATSYRRMCRIVHTGIQALLNNSVVGISTGGVAEVFEQNAREGNGHIHNSHIPHLHCVAATEVLALCIPCYCVCVVGCRP